MTYEQALKNRKECLAYLKENIVRVNPENFAAVKLSVEAIEKQIPVPVVKCEAHSQACPKCGYPVIWHFCGNCGQAIRYDHIEEENDAREDFTRD